MAFNAVAEPMLIRDTVQVMIMETMTARRGMCIVGDTYLVI